MSMKKNTMGKNVIILKRHRTVFLVALSLLLALLVAGFGCKSDAAAAAKESDIIADIGTLAFVANGEDFVREGMSSKESWNLNFDHAYITLSDIKAYQTDPPYDTDQGWDFDYKEMVELAGKFTIDLASPTADPAPVGQTGDAPAGHYNAISWTMARADSGPSEGYALLIVGTGEKDGQIINFTIGIEQEVAYLGGDYVGDERKGILNPGGSAEIEMTFHFDHLFGTDEEDPDDPMNLGALGFAPLAEMAEGGSIEVNMSSLRKSLDASDFGLIEGILLHFGHVGEGHCLAKFID
jgi:hypothetical protein